MLVAAEGIELTKHDEPLGSPGQEVINPEESVKRGLRLALTHKERRDFREVPHVGAAIGCS